MLVSGFKQILRKYFLGIQTSTGAPVATSLSKTPPALEIATGFPPTPIPMLSVAFLLCPSRRLQLSTYEANLDQRAGVSGAYDNGLVWAYFDEFVRPTAFSSCQRKFLVLSHFEFLSATPNIEKPDY